MSESADVGTATKARAKKLNGKASNMTRGTPGFCLTAGTTTSTIQIGFPTDAALTCSSPFQTMGTNAATTVMDPTCKLYTPNGILTGMLDATPPLHFTWSYTFTDALPQGVPLAVLVTGMTNNGAGPPDQNIQPFQCQ